MLSKIFSIFKSKPKVETFVVQHVPEPIVRLGPEKEETVEDKIEIIENPTTQQLEDAFKEEPTKEPEPVEVVTESTTPLPKKRSPRKPKVTTVETPEVKVTKNGKKSPVVR